MDFQPTRAAGLARLDDFVARAGRAYANNRNHDDGVPADGLRRNVSQLSPWLHTGLLSEAEVIGTVLSLHSPEAAEKFIAEVFWRIYFKGYLEQRPTIWTAYCQGRDDALAAVAANAGLSTAYHAAIEGRTGIAAFDHWVRELIDTGYLHNHARMWFASIWIFTLRIDWHLGADFFLRHLIDGDAASNTLSWRWVGGLHTKGKTYLAREENIARFTANQPGGPLKAKGLVEVADPLHEPVEHTRRALALPDGADPDRFAQPYALLLHDEHASHASLDFGEAPALVISAARPHARSPGSVNEAVSRFTAQTVLLGAHEAARAFDCKVQDWNADTSLAKILSDAGITRIVMPYIPNGWTRDALMAELGPMIEQGQATELLAELDRATWPHAKAGFFGVKKQIGGILDELAIHGTPTPISGQ